MSHLIIFRKNRPSCEGFSLIELMTCIIIVALISSFAIPLYKNHINRARLLEGLALIEPIKATIQEVGLSKGFEKIKGNPSVQIGPPESFNGEAVDTITVLKEGKIEVTYHTPEGTLLFTPQLFSGLLKWSCVSKSESLDPILPPECKPSTEP